MEDHSRVLVIAAHPDDEVLGCGGTIARLAQKGHDVYIAILGEGVTSRYPQRDQANVTLLKTLHDSSRKVSELLKARDLFFYNLPDNRFDTIPLLDIIKIIEDLINEINPHMVFTQHGGDLNIDHALTFRATLTAIRPLGKNVLRTLYAYETASSTEWAFQKFEPVFRPTVFFNITETLDLKLRAMEFYKDELRPFPHPRSPEALRAAAQRWGSVAGVDAAEAFELICEVRR
jgi:LmbE family N-acetylglucosaminyl deacetylase